MKPNKVIPDPLIDPPNISIPSILDAINELIQRVAKLTTQVNIIEARANTNIPEDLSTSYKIHICSICGQDHTTANCSHIGTTLSPKYHSIQPDYCKECGQDWTIANCRHLEAANPPKPNSTRLIPEPGCTCDIGRYPGLRDTCPVCSTTFPIHHPPPIDTGPPSWDL